MMLKKLREEEEAQLPFIDTSNSQVYAFSEVIL